MIDETIMEIAKIQTNKRISFALRQGPGTIGEESSARLRKFTAGYNVWIYRISKKKWCGPYKFIEIEVEAVKIQAIHGRKLFRSKYVKQYHQYILIKNHEGCKKLGYEES